ncbi:MAG: hypothetical protein IGR93_06630 [Hydrococcus sp. C42_A2020_068]|nr:hypothetical protein [Hydrococcus sp. C42_A2020_068]
MTHYFVLSIHPQAQYDWDKCILRHPITGERPDFNEIIAQAVGNEAGSYLIRVNIEVQVLEKAALGQSETVSLSPTKGTKAIASVKSQELLAS